MKIIHKVASAGVLLGAAAVYPEGVRASGTCADFESTCENMYNGNTYPANPDEGGCHEGGGGYYWEYWSCGPNLLNRNQYMDFEWCYHDDPDMCDPS